jgi:hypothetical protein
LGISKEEKLKICPNPPKILAILFYFKKFLEMCPFFKKCSKKFH